MKPAEQYLTLTVQPRHRKSDPKTVVWYFDSVTQRDKARDYALDCHAQIWSGTAAEVPKGDFVTDADEFINWMNGEG